MNNFEAINKVRHTLGLGLRAAHDFVMTNPSTVDERLAAQIDSQKKGGGHYVSPEEKIRTVIREYYRDLDNREHGDLAQNRAFEKLEALLGMSYQSWKSGNPEERVDYSLVETSQLANLEAKAQIRDAMFSIITECRPDLMPPNQLNLGTAVVRGALTGQLPPKPDRRYSIGGPPSHPIPDGWMDDFITCCAKLRSGEMPGVYFAQGVAFAEWHYGVSDTPPEVLKK